MEYNVPNLLRDGPKSLQALSELCGAKPKRLQQVLKVLYNNGIFNYDSSSDQYSNNHTSELLLTDHWTQWHNWVDLYGNVFYDIARGIPASISKDSTRMAAQVEFDTDMDMFSYFASRGWVERLHRTLGGGATAQASGIIKDYPWHEIAEGTVLDVGGGEGALLALLLKEYPSMKGALLDQMPVIDRAKSLFYDSDGKYAHVANQIDPDNMIVGNFLEKIPTFKYYTMKWCLHDWDDTKAITVLRNIRSAIEIGPDSRLIILEAILADGRARRLSRYADITMMVSANGEERTEAQWRRLADQTGWKVTRLYHLRGAWPQAIELRVSDEHGIGSSETSDQHTDV